MPIRLESFASYQTEVRREKWPNATYSASMFVKSLKRIPFKGYGHVPYISKMHRIDGGNPEKSHGIALKIFAEWTLDRLFALGYLDGPCCLAPIPRSRSTKEEVVRGATDQMADEIERLAHSDYDVQVDSCLEWECVFPPTRRTGMRDVATIYRNSVLASEPLEGYRYVLIDDVCTSGSHLRACARRLRTAGIRVPLAVVAGLAHHDYPPMPKPFRVPTKHFADFTDPI